MNTPACLRARARLYAFVGNSLLDPPREDTAFGLDPSFWDEIAVDAAVPDVALRCVRAASERLAALPQGKAVERVAVAHAKLFAGPGTPVAPPWETLQRSGGTVLFGQATFDVRADLRALGLHVDNENHQLEDHMGIELLFVSVLHGRLADACERADEVAARKEADTLAAFVRDHPGAWVAKLRDQVEAADATGYYAGLMMLAEALLAADAEL